MFAKEEACMKKGSEARAAEMFQELLLRLTDTWTEELFGNLKWAAAPDQQLLEVMRLIKNEGEKCTACQEGENTYKAKRCFKVDIKDHSNTRWSFCIARGDAAEAFQSLVAFELQAQWLWVTFLEERRRR